MITITDGTATYTITDEQIRIAERIVSSLIEYIKDVALRKFQDALDEIIYESTNYNPAKLSVQEKLVEARKYLEERSP